MSVLRSLLAPAWNSRAIVFIRLAAGLIFFTQGILKYADPHMGVMRFTRIGFPYPGFTAHFVGFFEIVCGFGVDRRVHQICECAALDYNPDGDRNHQNS